jgi:hypothetical protein
MTYKINKTDGSLLTEVIDSAVDTTATDLALIGKNVTGYGEYLNENFVKLLENFASTSEPNNPITGQVWFDLSENRLKVYDGNGFRIGSGPIVSGTAPLNPIQGDFWIDSEENQLYFYDGTDRVLAGPVYKDSQGISGFEVDTIADTDGNSRVIVKVWAGQTLMGIYSKYTEFTPASLIPGFTGTVKTGFNASSLDGFKIHARAESADALVDALGNLKTAASFMFTDDDNVTTGSVTINNPVPLSLGVGNETSILVSSTTNLNTPAEVPGVFEIRNGNTHQDFLITVKTVADPYVTAVRINTADSYAGIFNPNPTAMLHVGTPAAPGNVIVEGNLTVNGTTTTINSTVLSVDDINIILGSTASPTDVTANGGGITLKGTTDKTFTWNDATDSWTSNQHLDIGFGKSYKINGSAILTSTALGSTVVSSSLTSIGTLTTLRVGNLQATGNTISSTSGNIIISPFGTATIDVASSYVTNVLTPDTNPAVTAQRTYAVNKAYVDDLIGVLGSAWTVVNTDYQASSGDRLLVSTNSGPFSIVLPKTPAVGDQIRFIDLDGTFDTDNLTIKRYREVDVATIGGTSGFTAIGTYIAVPTIAVTGVGTGLEVTVVVTATGTTYTSANTTITVISQGIDYLDTNTIKVLGTDIGGTSPANDLIFDLSLDNIIALNSDLVLTRADNAFGLIYVNPAQGWKYTENLDIVGGVITADVVGNVTGNVTGDLLGNVTGNLLGDVTGNLNGTVTGNVIGDVAGDVTGDVIGDLTGNVTGDLTGDVTGNITGDVTTNNILSALSLQISAARNVELNIPLQLKAYDTSTRDALSYRGLIYNSTSKIVQYYDGVTGQWQNCGLDNNNSVPRFRLPTYSAADIATLTSVQAGEVVFDTDALKAKVFDGTVWQDLW